MSNETLKDKNYNLDIIRLIAYKFSAIVLTLKWLVHILSLESKYSIVQLFNIPLFDALSTQLTKNS